MAPTNKKHKAFAEHYTSTGLNATASYLAVYGNMEDNVAAAASARLLRNVNVREYIVELQAVTSSALSITKEELIQDLLDIKNSQKNVNSTASIKAIELISKMCGFNAPTETKTDITLRGEQPLFGPILLD